MWLIISHVWEDHTIKVYFEKIQYSSDSKENCDKAIFIFISRDTLKNYSHMHQASLLCRKRKPSWKRLWLVQDQRDDIMIESEMLYRGSRQKQNKRQRFLRTRFYVYYYTCTHMHKGEKQRWGAVFSCLLAMTKEPYVLIKCFISLCKSDVRSIK